MIIIPDNLYIKCNRIKTSTNLLFHRCGKSFVGMIQGEQYIYLSRKCSTNVSMRAQ